MCATGIDQAEAASTIVVGVGGAGCNAAARLIGRPPCGLKILCANTDARALRSIPVRHRLQLGPALTNGHGAGSSPTIGRAAAQEVLPDIVDALAGVTLCFIVAGLGGGTGSGAAPVVARAARAQGILTIGIVITPFPFEGLRRVRQADRAVEIMAESVDALVVVSNENLLRVVDRAARFRQSLAYSDRIVGDSILDLAAMVGGPALKRLTVADIRSVLVPGGRTVIGHGGRCSGTDRAVQAAVSALSNPLLDEDAAGARHILVTISGGQDLGLFELEQAVAQVRARVHPDADLVWGSTIDPALDGVVRVGITAAGLPPRARTADDERQAQWNGVQPLRATRPAPDVVPIVPSISTSMQAVIVDCVASACVTTDAAPAYRPSWIQHAAASPLPATPTGNHERFYSRARSAKLSDRLHFATLAFRRRLRPERRWIDQVDAKVPAPARRARTKPSKPVGTPVLKARAG